MPITYRLIKCALGYFVLPNLRDPRMFFWHPNPCTPMCPPASSHCALPSPAYHSPLPAPSEREKLMYMSGLSFVVIFFLTSVASVVFSALVTGAALVALHGATRVPDDLFIDDADVSIRGR